MAPAAVDVKTLPAEGRDTGHQCNGRAMFIVPADALLEAVLERHAVAWQHAISA
jgi:hypothetical protein